MEFIISAIPVYNAKNIAYARSLFKNAPGEGSIPWLDPYPDSVRGICDHCEGDVWVGPSQNKRLEEIENTGDKRPQVLCHFCTVIMGYFDGSNLIPLSSKNTKMFDG